MHVSKLNISFVPLHWINKNNMLASVHPFYTQRQNALWI